jgi:hypothetical protein
VRLCTRSDLLPQSGHPACGAVTLAWIRTLALPRVPQLTGRLDPEMGE